MMTDRSSGRNNKEHFCHFFPGHRVKRFKIEGVEESALAHLGSAQRKEGVYRGKENLGLCAGPPVHRKQRETLLRMIHDKAVHIAFHSLPGECDLQFGEKNRNILQKLNEQLLIWYP